MINRLLIVGYGSIGKRHLRIARETLPEADIRVLRHQPYDATLELADGCYSSLEETCAFAPQAAVIANPAPFHLDTALALTAVGSHLLIEKPLSHTTNGVQRLLQSVREKGLILQVGYNLRFLSSLEKFRERIRAGAIGRVLSVHAEIGQYLPSWRPETDYRLSVSAKQELGGGVLLELSHELDYLRWIFGEVAWVNAWLGRQSGLVIDVEDTAHLTLGFKPDTSGWAPVATLCLDFVRHDTTRACIAIGEQGSLRWDGLTGRVDVHLAEGADWQPVFHHAHQRNESYRAQWQHFLNSVQTGLTPRVAGEDGLAVLEIIQAARQSAAAQGARVAIISQQEMART